jgi:hypothetical protein
LFLLLAPAFVPPKVLLKVNHPFEVSRHDSFSLQFHTNSCRRDTHLLDEAKKKRRNNDAGMMHFGFTLPDCFQDTFGHSRIFFPHSPPIRHVGFSTSAICSECLHLLASPKNDRRY